MSEKQKERTRIFLSYAAADREAARRVSDAFTGVANTRVFTTEMLSAGGDWQTALRKEIASSDLFVLVLSHETHRSDFVLQELGAAWALAKPVVVVMTKSPFRNLDFHPTMAIAAHHTVLVDELNDPETVNEVLALRDEASTPDAAAS